MDVDAIRAFCLAFPDATENMQWGDDLCFKVRGKIFTIVTLDEPKLCFKCSPDVFAELIERADIHLAPYVGRYQWVMLDRLDALRNDELKSLIQASYEMVVCKAPKRARKSNQNKSKRKRSKKKKNPRISRSRKR